MYGMAPVFATSSAPEQLQSIVNADFLPTLNSYSVPYLLLSFMMNFYTLAAGFIFPFLFEKICNDN